MLKADAASTNPAARRVRDLRSNFVAPKSARPVMNTR